MLHLLVDRGTERSLSLLFPRPEKPILGPREGIRPFPVISLEPTAPWAATRTCWHNHFQVWPVAGTGKGALVIFDGFSPTARGRKAGLVHQAELVGISRDVKLTWWVGVFTVVAFVGVWSIPCAELLVEPLPLFGIEETRKATAKMVKARRTTTQANMRQLYSPRKARRCWLLKGMMMV